MYNSMGDDYDDGAFGFEEYAMDDTLDAITRLERYHTSDFSLQRLVLVRELSDTATDAGYGSTIQRMLPLLGNFVGDSEPAVRQAFVEQLYPVAMFLISGGETGYQELINTFLPFTFELLVDKNVQVGISATNSLTKLVELVREEHVDSQLLSVVVTLSHDERAEDCRIVAAQLFNELASKFGPERCKETVIKEVAALAAHTSFSMRKVVASNVGNIMKTVGEETAGGQVLPVYLTLCADDIWGVRKACVEHICEVSRGVSRVVRKNQLADAFVKLAEDSSRWVKVGAMQKLGEFITTFPREDVPTTLVKLYAQMAPEADAESDFSEYCAFSFPAVVDTVGKERWKELESAFICLAKDVGWKVRRSLSFSLHEISATVGQDISEKILTQAFDLFLRDLDEVKVGCLTHVADFLKCLGDTSREKRIRALAALPAETENWRLRELIARNLGDIAAGVSPKVCKDLLQEPVIRLCEDQVADVRVSAQPSCAKLLQSLSIGDQHHELLKWMSGLQGSGTDTHFQRRQMYIKIAGKCVVQGCLVDHFLEQLEKMADDRLPNVRLVLAESIAEVCRTEGCPPRAVKIRSRLTKDTDRDVQCFIST
eukprot:Hpha_TRINITY_DN16332_c2_g8::TRINITY_DN16332_c2_g8_i1::g.60909::m.60909/K15424/PPP4R1; serine/threonine-protein phosphatase 4 regulatory subunit 1